VANLLGIGAWTIAMLSQTATLKYRVIHTTSLFQCIQSCETVQRSEASAKPSVSVM